MKTSTNHAYRRRRLAIFNLLILNTSLLMSQSAVLAQSRVRPAAVPVVKEEKRESGNSIAAPSTNRAGAASGTAECITRMAAETAEYIQQAKIPLKGGRGEYFADQDAAVFLLSSEEKLNVSDGKRAQKKVVAVLHYQPGGARSAFYVIEAETRDNSIVYSLKQDSRLLKSFAVRLQRPKTIFGPGVDPCTQINKDNADFVASLQSAANQTCRTQGACIGVCSNFGNTIAWTIISVEPTYWKCLLELSALQPTYDFGWLVAADDPPHGPLIDWTVWTALRKDHALFY